MAASARSQGTLTVWLILLAALSACGGALATATDSASDASASDASASDASASDASASDASASDGSASDAGAWDASNDDGPAAEAGQDALSDGGLDAAEAGDVTVPDTSVVDADADSVAVAYQIDPAHTGSVDDALLLPPLRRLWVFDAGASSSYPVIAGGTVFSVVASINNAPATIIALDAKTGATVWGPTPIASDSETPPGPAYEAGRVFTLSYTGGLMAFDAGTGQALWSIQLPGQPFLFDAPPTPYRGVLYVSAVGGLYAVAETSGTILWTASVGGGGDMSSPALSPMGAFVDYELDQIYAVDPQSGVQLWHDSTTITGGGGATPVLFGSELYVFDPQQPVIVNAATGQMLGPFTTERTPAFHGTRGFFVVSHGQLQARDATTQSTLWSYVPPNGLVFDNAPLVVNGYVYGGIVGIQSQSELVAVDETTGSVAWSENIADLMGSSEDFGTSQSFGAAEGLLVVPMAFHIVGYASATTASDP